MEQLSFFAGGGGLTLLGDFRSGLLNAGVGAGGEFRLELFDAACRIDVLQLAGEEGVASRANIDLQFLLRTAGLERIAAAARDGRLDISGMDAVFHGLLFRHARGLSAPGASSFISL